jgi:F-type H+-transporting ATPase subunit delta
MVNRKAARRYARALFNYARGAQMVEQLRGELGVVCDLLHTTPEFGPFMSHPLIAPAEKQRFIAEALGAAVSEAMLGFLGLLIDHRRTDVLPAVLESYGEMADAFEGIIRARVESAAPLTDAERQTLAARLGTLFRRRAELEVHVNPELLGGVRVQVGRAVMDGTLRTSLDVMRDMLREVRVRVASP